MAERGWRPNIEVEYEPTNSSRAGETVEGEFVAAEFQPREATVPCMWGNGECPKSCKLYEASARMADEQSLHDDPDALRKAALNAVIERETPISLVARNMNKCANEPKE